jgi:hypothetical protein
MLLLRAERYPDLIGILHRSLLEAWYAGIYFVLAPDEAMERISAAHVSQLTKLDPSKWGDQQAVIDKMFFGPKGLSWEGVSRRVGELLAELGHEGARETAYSLYETLYRGESMMSVHGGVGTLIGHFDMPADTSTPTIGILEVRREPEEGGSARIRMAASLEGYLAVGVAGEFGLQHVELERLGALISDE